MMPSADRDWTALFLVALAIALVCLTILLWVS